MTRKYIVSVVIMEVEEDEEGKWVVAQELLTDEFMGAFEVESLEEARAIAQDLHSTGMMKVQLGEW